VASAPITDYARAKVNLTLRVLGRRPDGYHTLQSLVAFADECDTLTLTPQDTLTLKVAGRTATQAGADADNLVLRAARALSVKVPGLQHGEFKLEKDLPVAAGLGGGSADAAAALRLLARLNVLELDDARLIEAAREVGADVPVCLDPRARMMGGIGHDLSVALALPALPAVLINPGVAVATRDVFAALKVTPMAAEQGDVPSDAAALRTWISERGNDLEPPALALAPVIGDVLAALKQYGARVARMSGSGATCFGLFEKPDAARAAALTITRSQPAWWVRATMLR
jgi:4-diphosphocytidyl-2-C-methyl-D-erythritol kinase